MGALREISTGRRVPLPPELVIGRSRQADLRLTASRISSLHAAIWWDGRRWRVRDLDSRNHTFLEGCQVQDREGEPLLRGQMLAFGHVDDSWLVDDDAPPRPMAVHPPSERFHLATDGVLSLPEDGDPSVTVHAEDEIWWLERAGEEPTKVNDREPLPLAGQVWVLRLPEATRRTEETDDAPQAIDLSLSLRVSRDGETIVTDLLYRGARIGLDPRTHHEVLLQLARQRLDDAHLPEPERGWIDPESLARMVNLQRNVLNVYVKRLRGQFEGCGVVGEVIERRQQTWSLRLAAMRIDIGPLAEGD